jgi:hypothetical protein
MSWQVKLSHQCSRSSGEGGQVAGVDAEVLAPRHLCGPSSVAIFVRWRPAITAVRRLSEQVVVVTGTGGASLVPGVPASRGPDASAGARATGMLVESRLMYQDRAGLGHV